MENYTVYMLISPDTKKYIGITGRSLEKRWGKNGIHYSNHRYLGNAIKKYGWNNFKKIILADHLSKEWACQLEKLLIIEYKTKDTRYGYNLSDGGEYNAGFHYKRSEKFIEYIRKVNTGRHPSEEARKKMSENNCMKRPEIVEKMKATLKKSQKERTQKRMATMKQRYPNGFKPSEEQKKKISDALKGRKKSEDTKQKMRKPKSPEAIENMRKAQKEAWQRRKAKMELTNLSR